MVILDVFIEEIIKFIINFLFFVVLVMINDWYCFEMYGYDVMLDENLWSWFIEVNVLLLMSVDSVSDRVLKMVFFEDVLNVVDMEK